MQFGDFKISIVSDGNFRLDGGAMFGVVPKNLWQKLEPADEFNRIKMGMNCLLIEKDDLKILVDNGIGNKFDAKMATIYGLEREKTLLDELAENGVTPDQITHVVMTHMHFDHIGWNTRVTAESELEPTFANAEYIAQRGEFEVANNPDPRSRASYLKENWQSVVENAQLKLVNGSREILPGIEQLVTGGHTRDHSIIKIEADGKIAAFLADLVPTPSHLKTPYVMSYDLFPLDSMDVKPKVLQQAFEENWLVIFEHSAEKLAGYIQKDGKNWVFEKIDL